MPFFTKIVFSVMQLIAIDWSGDIKRDFDQKMTTSDLWHCILTFRRPSGAIDHSRPSATREYCSRAIRWSFPLSSTMLTLETQVGDPPLVLLRMVKWPVSASVNRKAVKKKLTKKQHPEQKSVVHRCLKTSLNLKPLKLRMHTGCSKKMSRF